MHSPKLKNIRISIPKLLLICLLTSIFSGVYSQDCRGFHKTNKCNTKTEKGFNLYGQSKSALFEVDSTFSYDLIFYGRKDYVFSVCTSSGYGPIHFKIIDKETNNVFYDNIENGYIESVGFTIDSPQEVRVEISLLTENSDINNFSENRACVGVLILWRKASRLGF